MNQDEWRQIDPILDRLFDAPPEDRDAILEDACSGDAPLRARVESMLGADRDAGAFLERPVGEAAAAFVVGPESPPIPPRVPANVSGLTGSYS